MPALRIAGYSQAPMLLDDAEAVRQWFIGLVERIGVTIVNGPTLVSFKDSGMPDAGLSGFAIIAESHIAWHSWPEKAYFMAEVTSCKGFDARQAGDYTLNYFRVEQPWGYTVDLSWGTVPPSPQKRA